MSQMQGVQMKKIKWNKIKYQQRGTCRASQAAWYHNPLLLHLFLAVWWILGAPVFTWYITSFPKWLVAFNHVCGEEGEVGGSANLADLPPSPSSPLTCHGRWALQSVAWWKKRKKHGGRAGARRDVQPLSVALYKRPRLLSWCPCRKKKKKITIIT